MRTRAPSGACGGTTGRADRSHTRTANGASRYSGQTRPVRPRPSSLSVLDALEQPLGAGGELIYGAGERVAQVALDVRPHALGGVEFGSLGRQLDHGQPVVVRLAEPAHRDAAVHVEVRAIA